MNAASAAGDFGKADGGGAAAAAWIHGAAQSASRAAAAAGAAGEATQINSRSTIVNGNAGIQININQGGDFQLHAGSGCSADHAIGSDGPTVPNAAADGTNESHEHGGGTAEPSVTGSSKIPGLQSPCWFDGDNGSGE